MFFAHIITSDSQWHIVYSVALELQSQIDQLRAGLVTEIEQLREENRRLRSEVGILLQFKKFYRLYSVEQAQAREDVG